MASITVNEKKLMSKIINHGYNHAAKSFSSMTGQKVTIEGSEVELCSKHDYLKDNLDHLKNITVLQTDVIGQIQGASYLIFNEQEKITVSEMTSAAFGPNSKLEDDVILMEIDNIISAAVITELSNSLKLSIYGDVPQLYQLKDIHDFHKYINEGNSDYYLLTRTKFIFENHTSISPIFIWKMDKMLIEFVNATSLKI
ncbi:hypothetical protein [Fulvivirga sp.]|uniref:hypothetical protein n=1 Tax=Fulvivirga sp. TaxID=1931237 RepID=UPI0032F0733F